LYGSQAKPKQSYHNLTRMHETKTLSKLTTTPNIKVNQMDDKPNKKVKPNLNKIEIK
jgi:hypothetical protein